MMHSHPYQVHQDSTDGCPATNDGSEGQGEPYTSHGCLFSRVGEQIIVVFMNFMCCTNFALYYAFRCSTSLLQNQNQF